MRPMIQATKLAIFTAVMAYGGAAGATVFNEFYNPDTYSSAHVISPTVGDTITITDGGCYGPTLYLNGGGGAVSPLSALPPLCGSSTFTFINSSGVSGYIDSDFGDTIVSWSSVAPAADTTPPTVSSVTASTANGSYKTGDVISIQVTFSEAVTVTGTPQLTLETGVTDQTVNYSSGSGTTALTFSYTVQSGDSSSDLDYTSTSALALNGGLIRDGASNNATLTLPSPGAANSLGANKNIIIDGVAPTVSSVSSPTSNGTYRIGDVISITVNFDETVTVTGTPQLTLETGVTDRTINYSSGSGSSTLTFSYTVQSGDSSSDLDYTSTSALALNGGTIRDGATNSATLTLASPGAANSLGGSKNIVIDGVRPTATIVVSDSALRIGDTPLVTFTFSEAVSGFTNADLTIANGALSSVSSSDGGVTWTATLTPTSNVTDATNVITLDMTGVTDAAANTGTGTTDSNNYAIDTAAPTVASVSVPANGTYVTGDSLDFTVNFDEAVTFNTGGGTPLISVTIGSSTVSASYISGSGTASAVFRYTVGASDLDQDGIVIGSLSLNGGTIQDAVGNDATLTLNSVASTTGVLVNVLPTITSASYDASTGVLSVTASDLVAAAGAVNDIAVSTLTLTGEGGATYTLTSSDVEITSSTAFSVTLNAVDQRNLAGLLNKNGTQSDDSTTYNLAAADDWAAGATASADIADTINAITVSNVAAPTITSATYDALTGVLAVTGSNFAAKPGAGNDIAVSTLTLTGEGGATYTLTSSDVEIVSATAFSITLNASDAAAIGMMLNKNGTASTSGTTYNLTAADDWNQGAAASVDSADLVNGVTVSNVAVPTITSATYDGSTGVLVVTGTGFLSLSGATNDILVPALTITGQGGASVTLTSSDVDITSSTSFSVTLVAQDQTALRAILTQNGTAALDATTYNIAAAEDWNQGAASAVVTADLTGNGLTASNVGNDSDASVTGTGSLATTMSTITDVGSPITALGLLIQDGGTSDGRATAISQIVVQVGGTTTDAERAKITWLLDGNDAAGVTGSYNAAADTITFSGLSLSIADGDTEAYSITAYFNDPTGLTEGHSVTLSMDGDTDMTLANTGTQMAATSAVTNGAGFAISVDPTRYVWATEGAGSVSGQALTTQPVVEAQDDFGNRDTDFAETITLALQSEAGSLSGNVETASAGVATFTGLTYSATGDQESFSFMPTDQTGVGVDLTTAPTTSLVSDVVATELVFATEPGPITIAGNGATAFATVPVVLAKDADGLLDQDYTTGVTLTVTDPDDGTVDGTVNSLAVTGDTDVSPLTATVTPVAGVATFSGLTLDYDNAAPADRLALRATSGSLTAVSSTALTSRVNIAPTLSGGPAGLTGTDEDTTSAATSVPSLLGMVTAGDLDGDALGVVITGSTGNGTWQYSTDGVNWASIGTVSAASGAVLSSTSQIRYVPDGIAGETATLTFVAWDGTTGTASTNATRSTADTTANGGTTAFSTGTATAQITMTDVNDAPTLAAGPVGIATTDEDTASAGLSVATILSSAVVTASDVDGDTLGLAITAATGNGGWEYSTDGVTWTAMGSVSTSGALLISSTSQIRYVPDGLAGETVSLSYRIWDGTSGSASVNGTPAPADTTTTGGTSAFSAASGLISGTVTDVNDAPTLGQTALTLSATDDVTTSGAVTAASLLTQASAADTDLQTLGLVVTGTSGAGAWEYSTDGTNWAALGTVSAASGAVLSSGTQLRYVPVSGTGETATLTFVAWDGTTGTASTNATRSTADTTANGGTTAFSTASATASLNVTISNTAPTLAIALVDQSTAVRDAFVYTVAAGSFVDAQTAQVLTYTATLTDGSALPTWLSFDPSSQTFSGTAQLADLGTLSIRVTATDDATTPLSVFDDFTLEVTTGTAPVITGPATLTVAENQTAVTQFTASESVAWAITGGADQALFQIASDGTITFATAPDFEAPTDANTDNAYEVTVSATDIDTNAVSQSLAVTVSDVEERMPNIIQPGQSDLDGDLVADAYETGDRDGDGISDAADYDPQGYFYCQDDGRILSGGAISVSGPAGSNAAVGLRNNIDIIRDGSTGEYQWFATAPGTYAMSITYPAGVGVPSTDRLDAGLLDLTSLLPANPASIGSSEFGATGILADPSQAANPRFFTVIDVELGDPNLIGNNIAMQKCGANAVRVTSATGAQEPADGESKELVFTLTMTRTATVDTVISYTLGGTATAGDDFTAPSGSVTIAAGATTATIRVPVLQDHVTEGNETLSLTLAAITSGDPTTSVATAPDNSASATIGDGLVDLIRPALTDVLAEDMRQTIEEQQSRFDGFAKGARERLKAGPDAVACGTVKDGAPQGALDVKDGTITASGSFGQNVNDCTLNERRITQGDFAVSVVQGQNTAISLSLSRLQERFVGPDRLRGRFIGGYIRGSQVANGTAAGGILGFGVNYGRYGAKRLSERLMLDYYAAIAAGHHRYQLDFAANGIAAKGGYSYAAVFAGAALSGEVTLKSLTLTPRMGVQLAFGRASKASVTATQLGRSDIGAISLPDYKGARLFAELTLGKTVEEDALDLLNTQLEATPRLFCTLLGGKTECAIGGTIELRREDKAQGLSLRAKIDAEATKGRKSVTFIVERRREFDDNQGHVATGISLGADGRVMLKHDVELRF